jgi:hypothetical protein
MVKFVIILIYIKQKAQHLSTSDTPDDDPIRVET